MHIVKYFYFFFVAIKETSMLWASYNFLLYKSNQLHELIMSLKTGYRHYINLTDHRFTTTPLGWPQLKLNDNLFRRPGF